MHIKRVIIDCFGLFQDRELGPLSPGFNLVAGPNEAGKTTVLAFIRNMLFGFPPGTSKEAKINDYRLGEKDRLGGRLIIGSDKYEGSLTVERHSGKGLGPVAVRLPDGGTRGQELLEELFGSLDRDLYRKIFAFGLAELSNLESMSASNLQARFYSAGTGTGAVAVPEALDRLEKERAGLFLPGGSKPTVNALLRGIRELEKDLKKLGTLTDDYAALTAERGKLEQELEELNRRDRENALALDQKKALLKGRETWSEHLETTSRLEQLESLPEDFPQRAGERLDEMNVSISKAVTELESLERRIEEEKVGLVRDEYLEKIHESSKRLVPIERGFEQYKKAADDLPKLSAELDSCSAKLDSQLAELNSGWKVEDLLGFDNSIPTSDRFRALEKAGEQAELELRDVKQSVRHAQEEFERAGQSGIQAGRSSAMRHLALTVAVVSLISGCWLAITGDKLIGGALCALGLAAAGWFWWRISIARLHAEKAARQKQLDRQVELHDKAAEAVKEQGEKMSRFIEGLGLEGTLSVDAVENIFVTVGSAREVNNSLIRDKKRVGDVEACIEKYSGEVSRLFAELGQEKPGRAEITGAVSTLLADSGQARKYHDNWKQLQQKLEMLAEQRSRQKSVLEGLRRDKKKLVSVSEQKPDEPVEELEERFRRHAAAATEREKWLEMQKEARSKLVGLAGSQDRLAPYMEELEKASFELLEQEAAALEEKHEEAGREEKQINTRVGELNEGIKQVSTETKGSRLRLDRSVAAERLAGDAGRWAVLTLARHAIRCEAQRYERERQPEVLRRSQDFFSRMTAGRYENIIAPLGEQRFEVCDTGGRRLPPGKLSRGTAEQLYLSLRFGLIEERAARSEPVPVMMDDILVNFDPARAAEACRAIARIAESHQVIYLTCHPHIVELIEKQIPGANKLEI
ncbi:MAG: AAA family ATPase [Gemmatimonadota bacterium]|nr:AAA family ATPase [Gemmatimonadota bacterium]